MVKKEKRALGEKNQVISVRLTPQLMERLEEASERADTKIGVLVRAWIEDRLTGGDLPGRVESLERQLKNLRAKVDRLR